MMQTRLVRLTATRCYIAQAVLEVPAFMNDERLLGIVRPGGSLAAFLSASMRFQPVAGTGLARSNVKPAPPESRRDFTLQDITPLLRQDGFSF